jgi:hypothetical protein
MASITSLSPVSLTWQKMKWQKTIIRDRDETDLGKKYSREKSHETVSVKVAKLWKILIYE